MNSPSYKPPGTAPLTHHAGTDVALILCALNANPAHLPADALRELTAHNDRLAAAPSEEIEATLRRQAILLEGVEHAYLHRAAHATRPEHQTLYAKTALHAQRALMGVLGALKAISEERKNAQAIDA